MNLAPPTLTQQPFGAAPEGLATLYTLRNARGLEAQITDYGGILKSLFVPDKGGKGADIVLGYDSLAQYLENGRFYGALVGRYANRIAEGRFPLEGKGFQLAKNGGAHHIHGGKRGFDKRLWKSKAVQKADAVGVELRLLSPDGEEGYPGNLQTQVTYWLDNQNDLRLEYEATCDQTTILCLTNHSYFNLVGAGSGEVLDHQLMLNAARFTPVDEGKIPTGELRDVADTPFDFREMRRIGERIDHAQLRGGYDHNFVLDGKPDTLKGAARVLEPTSGREMEVWTTEPGVQFYTGKGAAFCLETQHFPDSPNHPHFPSTELRVGQTYRQTTIFRFLPRTYSVRLDL